MGLCNQLVKDEKIGMRRCRRPATHHEGGAGWCGHHLPSQIARMELLQLEAWRRELTGEYLKRATADQLITEVIRRELLSEPSRVDLIDWLRDARSYLESWVRCPECRARGYMGHDQGCPVAALLGEDCATMNTTPGDATRRGPRTAQAERSPDATNTE